MSGVDFGHRVAIIRGRGMSLRIHRRAVLVSLLFAVATVAVSLVTLATGDFELGLDRVIGALLGRETGIVHLVVMEWRMPRVVAAIVFGAALAVSGAIFQSITRNPLGSPDVMGFSTGAYTGALVAIVFGGGSFVVTATGSLVGGLLTAALVYLFAYRRGVQGFRLIIVGIGIGAMLESVNSWLILRSKLEVVRTAAIWGAGSLGGVRWEQVLPAIIVVVALLCFGIAAARRLSAMELGDDAASALGVNVNRSRLLLVLLGVSLTALVTAVTGPIVFLALAAPQIARRLSRSSGVALLPSAAIGAFLLAACDLVGQRLFAPLAIPVGIITVTVGGAYLVWLLVHEIRRTV